MVDVWRRTLQSRGVAVNDSEIAPLLRLAANYEARANPTWPMPGAKDLLRQLKMGSLPMGIVSNAQVFTPILVEDLLAEHDLQRGGFDLDLCFFSNRFRQAKPIRHTETGFCRKT